MAAPLSPMMAAKRRPRRSTNPDSRETGIPGMLRAPRPKQIPIEELSLDDLRNRFQDNKNLLSKTYADNIFATIVRRETDQFPMFRLLSSAASSSTFVERITAEQSKIQARIAEIESLEAIQKGMNKTTIDEDGMVVDLPEPSPAMLAKQKALAAWVSHHN